jgi:cobalt/nickel transport system permease protein
MHMSDALLSLPVAGAFWAVSAATLAFSARQLERDKDPARAPRMGVLAAFVFAAQMINFALPGTGSSGHFAGGTLLALLLGPWAAFMALASVLVVQSLFFADGGLLALGANMFNMGFIACFVAVPLVYRPLAAGQPTPARKRVAVMAAAMAASALGALSVTFQTSASGLTQLPFKHFALIMVPLHLAIGIVEGFISILVIEQLGTWKGEARVRSSWGGKTIAALGLTALLVAGVLSVYASTLPDGLEHSIQQAQTGPIQEPATVPLLPTALPEGTQADVVGTALVFGLALGAGWFFRFRATKDRIGANS